MTKENLQIRFRKEIAPALKKELGLKNDMAVPKVKMIKINVGIGSYVQGQGKDYSAIVENIASISGQKPVITLSRKAISNFKIRQGEAVGVTVTLRGKRMYDFLTKLINVVLPRVRDFRGLALNGFDNHGNYSVGFKEHVVFPEIHPDQVMKLHGLQISVVTSAKNDEHGLALLKAMGFPFQQKKGKKE